jgi:hypothetical protein
MSRARRFCAWRPNPPASPSPMTFGRPALPEANAGPTLYISVTTIRLGGNGRASRAQRRSFRFRWAARRYRRRRRSSINRFRIMNLCLLDHHSITVPLESCLIRPADQAESCPTPAEQFPIRVAARAEPRPTRPAAGRLKECLASILVPGSPIHRHGPAESAPAYCQPCPIESSLTFRTRPRHRH